MKKYLIITILMALFSVSVNAATVSLTVESQDDSSMVLGLYASNFGNTGLNGGSFSLDFDASIFQFNNGSVDEYWNFPGNEIGVVDNVVGSIENGGFSTFFKDGISVGDDASVLLIASFNFDIIGSGSSIVGLTTGMGAWSDTAGNVIEGIVYEGAAVEVSAVPVPAAAWLFLSGLGLFGFTARKKK